MSSPPSLNSLNISEQSGSSSQTPNTERPASPTEGTEDVVTNGDSSDKFTTNPTSSEAVEDNTSKPQGPAPTPTTAPAAPSPTPDSAAPTPTPAPAPSSRPSPSALSPHRPSPQIPSASAPLIPGRPAPGGGLRGGMQGPLGMGGRGRGGISKIPASLQAKMDAVAQRSQNSGVSSPGPKQPGGANPHATSMAALLRSQALRQQSGGGGPGMPGGRASPGAGPEGAPGQGGGGPQLPGPASGPLSSLAARRAGNRPNLGSMGGSTPAMPGLAGRRGPPGGLNLSSMKGATKDEGNKFTDYSKIMDPSGSLKFRKAVVTSQGVKFEDGASFDINMDEMDIVGELGKGNYGSVQQVFHRPTNIMMAMKEIRLELDESKLNGIIMELDILHRAVAPEIVEFYGAFTIESCVYYCMELMDAGSLDTLTGGGVPANQVKAEDEAAELRVPEDVLRRITGSIVRGLKFLKDELQIMHRDVKPTNVLINKKGEVKLVDFGVSGQLEKSLAKTNIGCQSYMAPERIKGESTGQASSYTASSDVWSVGLSIVELAKGCYPYPPETFANVFAQLTAIVHGPAPTLPSGYSQDAHDFVAKCLIKEASSRPTYAQLLEHPFLKNEKEKDVDMSGWVAGALEKRAQRGVIPLQTVEA